MSVVEPTPRNDLRFVQISYYMPQAQYGQTTFKVFQLLTLLSTMAFLVVAVLVQVTTWPAVHRFKLVATLLASILGGFVFLQMLISFSYMIHQSSRMSHRHNGPVYVAVAFTLGFTVLMVAYAFSWLVNWDLISEPFSTVAVNFTSPSEGRFQQYFAFWTFATVLLVYMMDIQVRALLAHFYPEGVRHSTETDFVPEVVGILVSSKKRGRRSTEDSQSRRKMTTADQLTHRHR